jgi:hypothetical protein
VISPGCTGEARDPAEAPPQTVNRMETDVGLRATPFSANLTERSSALPICASAPEGTGLALSIQSRHTATMAHGAGFRSFPDIRGAMELNRRCFPNFDVCVEARIGGTISPDRRLIELNSAHKTADSGFHLRFIKMSPRH